MPVEDFENDEESLVSKVYINLFKGIIRAHSILYNKLEAWQVFLYNFNEKVSREEHKTI